MSLRWRWALSIAAVGALAVALTTAIGLATTSRELRQQVDRDLRGRFELAVVSVPTAPVRRPFDRRDLVDLDAVVQVVVAGARIVPGDPELPLRGARELGTEPRLETVTVDGDRYRMISGVVPIERRPNVPRVVQLAIPIDGISEATALLLRRLVVVGALLAVGAGVVGWALARNAVRPIESLTRAADGLATSIDHDHALPTTAPGEVGLLARSFQRMVESVRASREQQRRLVADAGHEFRTPLTALRTNLETLLRRGDELDADQRRQLLEAAVAESAELAHLAEELVELASETGQREEISDLDLGEIAHTVASRFSQRSGRPVLVEGDGAPVRGQAHQIERALSNLVDNAVKWSPPDGKVRIV
ncbi:MAG: HAMP domain-containing sensor histidine kinase, partial [Acidimicrobiia bacterium]|nr:HAMP domain-containing sensor histidine kinase [Acidimicrobiia bacterium]